MTALRKVPTAALHTRPPITGTLVLILWQRTFAWPSWVYAVIWTLWGIILIASFVMVWKEVSEKEITESEWRRIFP